VKQGSRYYPLFERLSRSGEREVSLSFTEIEALIGTTLPRSARASMAWWSNRSGGVQAAAWMQAGYHVVAVDLAAERVTFRQPEIPYHVARVSDPDHWTGAQIKALRQHMDLSQAKFAEVLGVRQQTVSEWEQGDYTPTRATSKHLTRVAREARYPYLVPDNAQ
jgi:DNA-binding transcriptional regulator YiaG